MATQEPTTMRTEGVGALADRVLIEPERGSGYFFPTAAGGTAVWVIGFAFSLALLSLANAEWINLTALGIIVPVAYAVGLISRALGHNPKPATSASAPRPSSSASNPKPE